MTLASLKYYLKGIKNLSELQIFYNNNKNEITDAQKALIFYFMTRLAPKKEIVKTDLIDILENAPLFTR